MTFRRRVAWAIDDGGGRDEARIEVNGTVLLAKGTATALTPQPYEVRYDLGCGPSFMTSWLRVVVRREGAISGRLDLRRDHATGGWTAELDGIARPLPDVFGALDCDLMRSPTTNSMPVLRERLLDRAATVDLRMAFVTLPDLRVVPSRQRYEVVGTDPDGLRRIRYVSLDSDFVSELTFDGDGLVVDYPQLGRRVPA
jgi:hypothetical protein